MMSHCHFDLHFLVTKYVKLLFVCLLVICVSSLEKYLFKSLVYFKIDCFLLLNDENSVYILDKCPTSGVGNSDRAFWRNNLIPESLTGMIWRTKRIKTVTSDDMNGCLLIRSFFLSLIYKHYTILLKLKVNIF